MPIKNVPKNLCKGLAATAKVKCGRVLKPRHLWVELCDICNSNCDYCNIHNKKPIDNPLSSHELYKALSDPVFSNVNYIINSGGEPAVRKDFDHALLMEHKALPKATLQISTNGLLPEKIVNAITTIHKSVPNVNFEVGISLDGVGAEHDRIRGVVGNFEKVKYLISEMKRLGVPVSLGATLMEKNLENNLLAHEYALAQGVPFLYHWFNTGSFYEKKGESQKKIAVAVQQLPDGLYRDFWLSSLKDKPYGFRCFALNDFAVLKLNGDIVPCLSKWDQPIGNVKVHSPSEIWNSKEAQHGRNLVSGCSGCLNSWGCSWSLSAAYYPNLFYVLKRKITH